MSGLPIARPRVRLAGVAGAGIAGTALGLIWVRIWLTLGAMSIPHQTITSELRLAAIGYGVPLAVAPIALARFGDPAFVRGIARRAGLEILFVTALVAISGALDDSLVAASLAMIGALLARTAALQGLGPNGPAALGFVIGAAALQAGVASAGLVEFARAALFGLPLWMLPLLMSCAPFFVRFSEAALRLGGVRAVTKTKGEHEARPSGNGVA